MGGGHPTGSFGATNVGLHSRIAYLVQGDSGLGAEKVRVKLYDAVDCPTSRRWDVGSAEILHSVVSKIST